MKIAVTGGSGYLSSIINQNYKKKKIFSFFSRKNNINYFSKKNLEKKLRKHNIIIHLVGASKTDILRLKEKSLEIKKTITSNLCNLCIKYNMQLIYISSLHVYKNFEKKPFIEPNSSQDYSSIYSKAHLEAERIIINKLNKYKNKFIIIRVGNVFGFNKFLKIKELKKNLINGFCYDAVFKGKIQLQNGNIVRSFVPSKIFFQNILKIIKLNKIKNNIVNLSYKTYSLVEVCNMIVQRCQKYFHLNVNLIKKKEKKGKKVSVLNNINYYPVKKKTFLKELDKIIKIFFKMKKLSNA